MQKIDSRLAAFETSLGEQLKDHRHRMNNIEQSIAAQRERMTGHEDRMKAHDDRSHQADERFERIEDATDRRFQRMSEAHNHRMERVENTLNKMLWGLISSLGLVLLEGAIVVARWLT